VRNAVFTPILAVGQFKVRRIVVTENAFVLSKFTVPAVSALQTCRELRSFKLNYAALWVRVH